MTGFPFPFLGGLAQFLSSWKQLLWLLRDSINHVVSFPWSLSSRQWHIAECFPFYNSHVKIMNTTLATWLITWLWANLKAKRVHEVKIPSDKEERHAATLHKDTNTQMRLLFIYTTTNDNLSFVVFTVLTLFPLQTLFHFRVWSQFLYTWGPIGFW